MMPAAHFQPIDYFSKEQQAKECQLLCLQLPRMMWQHGDLEGLERHVLQSTEPALLTWWAQYCESNGKFDQALSCYKRAGKLLRHFTQNLLH
jgi:hypothetical protein